MQFFSPSLFAGAVVSAVFGAWGLLQGKHLRYFLIGFAVAAFGFFYVPFYGHFVASGNILPASGAQFQSTVLGTSRISESSQTLRVALAPPFRGTADVIIAPLPEFRYGDLLSFKGGPMHDAGNGHPLLVYPALELLRSGAGAPVKQFLVNIRDRVRESFLLLLSKDSAALLGGVTLGIRADFSDAFKQAMSRSGTTHLVALSGYNVAILAYAIFFLLGSWLPRRATLLITVIAIVLFVLMVGAEASVVRAAVMGVLLVAAQGAGRMYDPRNAIAFTAAAMLVYDPTLVEFDLGFLLSFLSLCGIVYLAPALAALTHLKKNPDAVFDLRGALLTTLAAQLAVIPVLLAHFGGISLFALITNMLLLEIVPFVMALGFALGLIAFVAMPLARILAWFAEIPLLYMSGVIYFFSSLAAPYGASFFSLPLAALYYAVLLGVILYAHEKQPAPS